MGYGQLSSILDIATRLAQLGWRIDTKAEDYLPQRAQRTQRKDEEEYCGFAEKPAECLILTFFPSV
jgi:hypothetical protein